MTAIGERQSTIGQGNMIDSFPPYAKTRLFLQESELPLAQLTVVVLHEAVESLLNELLETYDGFEKFGWRPDSYRQVHPITTGFHGATVDRKTVIE